MMSPDGLQHGADLDDPDLSILHLDMDSFYVSVEVQRDQSLSGRPVIVGGTGPRGVVASASYEARAFGVRSAMPTAVAKRRCPTAVLIQGDHAAYSEVSGRLHEIMGSVTPVIEPIALDEAFMDVSAARQLFGSGRVVAQLLRERIFEELSLTCSVGVARKKLFAKLASEDAKPIADRSGTRPGLGVRVVPASEELVFLHGLPVRALWGVGPRTLERLVEFGISTVGDLAKVTENSLISALGKSHGHHLFDLARGHDPRPVRADRKVKSISHEETFAHDVSDRQTIDAVVVRLSDAVAGRLRSHHLRSRTVQLKLRYGDFSTISRSTTSEVAIDTGTHIARMVKGMLDALGLAEADAELWHRGIRLVGVAATGLSDVSVTSVQLSLGTEDRPSMLDDLADWEDVSEAVDEIRKRFGGGSIGPSAAVGRTVPGRDLWGPSAERNSADDDR